MNDNPFTSPESTPSSNGVDPSPRDKNENTLGILCHLLALALFVLPSFGNIIGPLILWLVKRADSPYLDEAGKEALNFNISWTIYMCIAAFSIFALIGFVLFPLVFLAWLIFVIVGSIKASEGKIYRYPLTIRLIK
jgi:uncharacterized Tic20 family protein